MIIPELPAYLSSLGGAEFKGFIISLFTLTAGISRPFSGKLADTVGRTPVIIVGTIVCAICSLIYPVLTTVSGFLLLRFFHGFSTGFSPTATTAYVADIVPDHRRGEAMGIIGVSINVGSSISPPIGSYLAGVYSLDVMFYASSVVALISLLLLLGLKETLPEKKPFHPKILLLKRGEIIDKNSIHPAIVCGLTYMGFGVIVTIVPDQCEYLGMSNKGLFFSSITVFAIVSRLIAGRISDRYGRIPVMRFAIILLAVAHVLMGMSASPTWLLAASGFIGFSMGIAGPAIFAWTIDRSSNEFRGRALATLFIGLEMAIGLGALGGAAIYDNNYQNFGLTFYLTAFISLLALFFLKEDRKRIWKAN